MTETQERIAKLCKEKGIVVSQLEKELGLSNGYINGERKREFPHDRLAKIANALGVTTDYLTYGDDTYFQKMNRDFLAYQLAMIDQELGIENPAMKHDGQILVKDSISDKDRQLLKWFRSLSQEKQRAILIAQDAPEELL